MLPAVHQHELRASGKVRWVEMRCVHCGRLLQKIEQDALRPGKRIEIKCIHCKTMNYSTGREADATAER